jgi:site-specific DNA-cytosine methylase
VTDQQLTAVGCNIFAGGFTLGVERYFKVRAHLEHDLYGVPTFRLNRPHVPVHVLGGRGATGWPLERYRGVDLLYANPPCAIVSVCGRCLREGRDAWKTDPRTQRIRDIIGLTKEIGPVIMAMESVTQLYSRARELVNEQANELRGAGYGVTHLLVNTAWHGTPQHRKRYFLIAHRVGLNFERLNYAPPDTVGEVLGRVADPGWLPPVVADHARLWHTTKPGRSIRESWEREHPDPELWERSSLGVKNRPRFMEYRANPSIPLGVFYGDFIWHPTEPRRLGLEEAKAICGFPPEWKFSSPPAAFSELARGVMPDMAGWLARQLANSLNRADPLPRNFTGPAVSHVDLRVPPTAELAA